MTKIKTWIKLGDLFIDEENIRSIRKIGKNTIIEKINPVSSTEQNIMVEMDYSKVKKLVKAL